MTFDELTYGIDGERHNSFSNPTIARIVTDSRDVVVGDLFVAVIGLSSDGHDFVSHALQRGAVGLILDRRGRLSDAETEALSSVATLTVSNSMEVLGQLANRFFDYPFSSINSVAITGTNGKSTTMAFLESIFQEAQRPCGVIGTIFFRMGEWEIHSPYTTPESNDLMEIVRQFVDRGADTVVLEASSHGLSLFRVEEARFDVGVFTNLTHDHLDFHSDMESYFQAKRRLFSVLLPNSRAAGKLGKAVINADDPYGQRLLRENADFAASYGLSSEADIRATNIVLGPEGSQFDLVLSEDEPAVSMQLPIVGRHNIYNALAAVGAAVALGVEIEHIKIGLAQVTPIPGRLELVQRDDGKGPRAYVDYSHTPDALRHALTALRELGPSRLYVLFGCGGDRDALKRPEMARVASELADVIIITSDNPRTEDPEAIIEQIAAGVVGKPKPSSELGREVQTGCFRQVERKTAIEHILMAAPQDSLVLIAGKGHETTQTIGRSTVAFDDRNVAREALQEWSERPF